MARVTVEDCIEILPNRFELVTLAAQRAKQISAGQPLTIDRDNDKDAVVSLREIAAHTVNPDELRAEAIQNFSKYQAPEAPEVAQLEVGSGAANRARVSREEIAASLEEDAVLVADQGDEDGDAPSGMHFEDENVTPED